MEISSIRYDATSAVGLGCGRRDSKSWGNGERLSAEQAPRERVIALVIRQPKEALLFQNTNQYMANEAEIRFERKWKRVRFRASIACASPAESLEIVKEPQYC